jgi:hypothetical protein
MVQNIMKKELCGTFHAKCGTRDLTEVFGTVPRKTGRVVTRSSLPTVMTYLRTVEEFVLPEILSKDEPLLGMPPVRLHVVDS